jgi:hypothetical protein
MTRASEKAILQADIENFRQMATIKRMAEEKLKKVEMTKAKLWNDTKEAMLKEEKARAEVETFTRTR